MPQGDQCSLGYCQVPVEVISEDRSAQHGTRLQVQLLALCTCVMPYGLLLVSQRRFSSQVTRVLQATVKASAAKGTAITTPKVAFTYAVSAKTSIPAVFWLPVNPLPASVFDWVPHTHSAVTRNMAGLSDWPV